MSETYGGVTIRTDVPLAVRCADFYILESLYNEGRRIARPNGDGGYFYERSAPMDSRLELRQIEAEKRFHSYIDDMYEEFRTYLYVAAAGELSYIHNPDGRDYELEFDYCPEHNDEPGEWSDCGNDYDHGCDCEPDEDGDTDCEWIDGSCECCLCERKNYSEPDDMYYCDCNAPSWSSPSIFPKELVDWLQTFKGYGFNMEDWVEWAVDRGEQAAKWCALAFDDGNWTSGYGGTAWGLPYHMLADAEAGRMSRVTFIDRLWSIQHNGGSIFDKSYDVSAGYYDGWSRWVPNPHSLMRILEAQAADDYDTLSSVGTMGSLWRETKRLARKVVPSRDYFAEARKGVA